MKNGPWSVCTACGFFGQALTSTNICLSVANSFLIVLMMIAKSLLSILAIQLLPSLAPCRTPLASAINAFNFSMPVFSFNCPCALQSCHAISNDVLTSFNKLRLLSSCSFFDAVKGLNAFVVFLFSECNPERCLRFGFPLQVRISELK